LSRFIVNTISEQPNEPNCPLSFLGLLSSAERKMGIDADLPYNSKSQAQLHSAGLAWSCAFDFGHFILTVWCGSVLS
jgi:hypothetical protein